MLSITAVPLLTLCSTLNFSVGLSKAFFPEWSSLFWLVSSRRPEQVPLTLYPHYLCRCFSNHSCAGGHNNTVVTSQLQLEKT